MADTGIEIGSFARVCSAQLWGTPAGLRPQMCVIRCVRLWSQIKFGSALRLSRRRPVPSSQFRTVLAAAALIRLAALEIWVAFAGHSASGLHLRLMKWMPLSIVL